MRGGIEKPAGLGSRGVTASQLISSKLWWKGPEWLSCQDSEWPTSLVLEDLENVGTERKKVNVLSIVTENPKRVSNVWNAEDYSSRAKLLRVTAWVKIKD